MAEINLLDRYPAAKRPVEERGKRVTEEIRDIAREFGEQYFDGDRMYGYGGYNYHPRFWQETVKRFKEYYQLADDAKVLDVGCAKGYMMYDFIKLMPELQVRGLDISTYGITNAKEEVKDLIRIANAKELPYEDNSFDLVISINTVHNLPLEECKQSLREIQRVSRKDSFVTVDAYRNEEEKKRMANWNLTALTYMHVDDWGKLFAEIGYQGDYYWFIP